jgi:dsDNA-binding SOS-regulon protein
MTNPSHILGLEVGSLADWISGMGSLAAVIAAATIARSESKRAANAEDKARRIEDEARRTEEKTEADTRDHLLEITRRLVEKSAWIVQLMDHEENERQVYYEHYPAWLALVRDSIKQITRLQQFPGIPLSIFLYSDKLLKELEKPSVTASLNSDTQASLRTFAERVKSTEIVIVGES